MARPPLPRRARAARAGRGEALTGPPYPIACLAAGPGLGRIGFAPCPARPDDLDAIRTWGARCVLTLVEAAELEALGVPDLGAELRARGLAWAHLPIPDYGVPDAAFEAGWAETGARLRAALRDGQDVLLHCRGGLGRSGTIAARLLVELGEPAGAAIARVRAARTGAIETAAQEAHVHGAAVVARRRPTRSPGCPGRTSEPCAIGSSSKSSAS